VPAVQQSIDISWPPGPQQQTRHSGVQQLTDGMADRQTDARQFHKPRCAYHAGRANNLITANMMN